MNLTVTGVDKTISSLGIVQVGIRDRTPMLQAVHIIERDARAKTPEDRGDTKGSIEGRVVPRDNEIIGVVGSPLMSAVWNEKGTRPHWPPIHAIEDWAIRHGIEPYLVARAISRKGTKAHHMLQRALDDNQREIIQFFKSYYRRLTREAN